MNESTMTEFSGMTGGEMQAWRRGACIAFQWLLREEPPDVIRERYQAFLAEHETEAEKADGRSQRVTALRKSALKEDMRIKRQILREATEVASRDKPATRREIFDLTCAQGHFPVSPGSAPHRLPDVQRINWSDYPARYIWRSDK